LHSGITALWLPELSEGLQKLHRCVVLEPGAIEVAAIETLQIRRELYAVLHEQNDLLTVERHGRADFNENVIVKLCVLVAFVVDVFPFPPTWITPALHDRISSKTFSGTGMAVDSRSTDTTGSKLPNCKSSLT
jgi:hypothetical protein